MERMSVECVMQRIYLSVHILELFMHEMEFNSELPRTKEATHDMVSNINLNWSSTSVFETSVIRLHVIYIL